MTLNSTGSETRTTLEVESTANKRRRGRQAILPYLLVVLFVAMLLGFSIGLPGTFGTFDNFRNIVSSDIILLALALAVSFPLRAGDFDLSMANNMIVSGATSVILVTQHHMNQGAALACGILLGLAIGVVNGLLVVVMRMDAFIITLATQTILLGVGYGITGSSVVAISSTGFISSFALHEFLGLQAAVWYTFILAAIVWYVYEWTPYGRRLLFTGGNRAAARLAGVKVDRIRFSAFAICGLIAGFAGVLLVGTQGAIDPTAGGQFLLQPYAAVFLGATTIQLGRINVIGSVIGLYFLAVGVTGLELLGISSWVGELFNGAALLFALTLVRIGGLVRE